MIHKKMPKTIREWVLDTYEPDTIKDITTNGMQGGFSGLFYYSETTAFHDHYEDEIWNMLYDDATDQGCTVIELIAQFNGQKDVGSMHQFKNLLAWYAVERVCHELELKMDKIDEEIKNLKGFQQ